MSGLAGIVNIRRKVNSELENVRKMTEIQSHRGGKSLKVVSCGYGVFGCAASDAAKCEENGIPYSVKTDSGEYTICFDGLIYNTYEVKAALEKCGISCSDDLSDAELVLLSYIKWGSGCLKKLSGVFTFTVWNSEHRELFMARDRFGIKPLYYTIVNGSLLFSSEIKGLLAHPSVSAVLDRTGICEVMGLGPAQTQGCGILKDIKEILPSNCATFNQNGFNMYRYWQLVSQPFSDSFEDCLEYARSLTFNAINSQLEEKNRSMCFFLSGGLDSSAICALASRKYGDGINTFSLKYVGNDEYFQPTEYQPASDDYYIDVISKELKTNHHIVTIGNNDLIGYLEKAVTARDLPGMGDVDSSLYYLCENMGGGFNGALSGECADEVFGGYPWFHRKEDFDASVFPWAKNIDMRRSFISPQLIKPDEISEYIYSSYNRSIENTPRCADDSAEEARRREIAYLNLNWFMYTLGARSERIGMNCGLEIRMPYCDYKLVEYIWNVPWKYKSYNDREKGLLRMIFEDVLPEEVLWRKKSPFPKTHNPEYEDAVKNIVSEILTDGREPVCEIINKEYINTLMGAPSDYGKPWFGQLMATPQLYAYIIQLNFWLKHYNIKIQP